MGIPVIKLNLGPPPTPWRLHHSRIAWIVFAIGAIGLSISIIATVKAYREADMAGQRTVAITEQARTAQRQQALILNDLREVNVDNEMPRWRLAERILLERALPWSRITAELERSLVQDVRIKSIQRTRGTDHSVQLKLRGESRSQDAETDFIESLKDNFSFAQVILEREAEMTNTRGGLEFDYTLQLSTELPEYETLPRYGPEPGTPRRRPRSEVSDSDNAASVDTVPVSTSTAFTNPPQSNTQSATNRAAAPATGNSSAARQQPASQQRNTSQRSGAAR